MEHPDRQPVYDALDDMPDVVFAALLLALSGVNRVLAATVMDDPRCCHQLARVIEPFTKALEG